MVNRILVAAGLTAAFAAGFAVRGAVPGEPVAFAQGNRVFELRTERTISTARIAPITTTAIAPARNCQASNQVQSSTPATASATITPASRICSTTISRLDTGRQSTVSGHGCNGSTGDATSVTAAPRSARCARGADPQADRLRSA